MAYHYNTSSPSGFVRESHFNRFSRPYFRLPQNKYFHGDFLTQALRKRTIAYVKTEEVRWEAFFSGSSIDRGGRHILGWLQRG